MEPKHSRILAIASFALLPLLPLTSCRIVKPEEASRAVSVPSAFKGGARTGEITRPKWWTLFGDSHLNRLVEGVESGSLSLRAGLARIDQAYAVLGITRSELVPYLDGDGEVKRRRSSEGDQGGGSFEKYITQYRAGFALGWEIDLWGRVRYLVDAGEAEATAVEKAVDDLRLSLQAQVARNYFALRFLDEETRVLEEAVQTRRDNLKIASDRFEGGRTGELDVARADTELATTKADLARLAGPRTRLENAIAVLIGKTPSEFRIPARRLDSSLPSVRAGLPIEVLENRPDIAAAIARLDATNARIGVAKADFFPKVTLVGEGGLSAVNSNHFLTWSSRYFSIGPEVSLPVYQGGRLKANLAGRRAEQAEALADYQQSVLEAFRDVDDALADLAALQNERSAQLEAVSASKRARDLSGRRYEEGLVSSIEVIDAIREQLAAERRAVQIRGQQYEATVRLIQAIGGGLSREYTK